MNSGILLITTGRVVQILVSMASVRIFTGLLPSQEVGKLYFVTAFTGLFCLSLLSPVGLYINRMLHKWMNDKNIMNYFFVYNLYLFMIVGVAVLVVSLMHRYGGMGNTMASTELIILTTGTIYFSTWSQTILPSLNILDFRKSFVVLTILTLTTGLLLSMALTVLIAKTAFWWLVGQLISQTIFAVFGFIHLMRITGYSFGFRNSVKIINVQNLRFLMSFALPLALTTLFMWLQNQSYRVVIEQIRGLEFLGFLGLGMAISMNISSAAESVIQQWYIPKFYHAINAHPEQKLNIWNNMAQTVLPFYLSLTIFVTCTAPHLVNILASNQFSQSFIYVIYGAWIELFRVTTNILTYVAHAEMQTKYLIKAYLLGGTAAVAGCYIVAGHSWYQHAVPLILVFSGLLTTFMTYRQMKRIAHIKIGIANIRTSFIMSLPLVAATFTFAFKSLPVSLLTVTVCGLYFCLVQYRLAKPLLVQQ